jgi:hypothetical protein
MTGPRRRTSVTTTMITAGIVGASLLGACGGADSSVDAPIATASPDATADTVASATSEMSDTPDTGASATTAVPDDAPPTTIAPPAPAFDLSTIPDLVATIDQAFTDPAIAPLSVAQQMIGFPYAIPVPDGSTLYQFSAGLTWADDDGDRYRLEYWATAPGGAVPDVDINLDGNGPGSAQIVDVWDPIMAELGFTRTNSTASDPGDPGGPNSVNHVYVADTPDQTFNGVPGTVSPIFVWADEDINGGTYSGEPVLGGYRIDLEIDTAHDAGVPIPFANALLEVLPLPPGVALADLDIDLRARTSSSFDADKGLHYVSVHLEWEAPAAMLDDIIAFYSSPADVFTDEPTLLAGREDFFTEGVILRSELSDYDVDGKRLDLLLLRRYEGRLGIDASSDGTEPMTLFVDFDLDTIAPTLDLPAD